MVNSSDSLIKDVIDDLKKQLNANLIAVYGIGSHFTSPKIDFLANDIDLIRPTNFQSKD